MKPTDLPLLVQKLNGPMEALGALGAVLRIQTEGLAVDPRVHEALTDVLRTLGVDEAELAAMPTDLKLAIAGGIRAFLRQSVDLVENPDRPAGWSFDDPALLQSQGRLSTPVAQVIAQIVPTLGELGARLGSDGATFLDVGTGVAWLAIAMATTFPALRVVGLDVFAPALALAR
ncbi:MAG TPA: hypothetical protein VMS22_09655, partial [Candidatus Eisenbacteria bacterium]|nr:hypothetical protein [Candidatus Eisenbacteria bacterium]